MPENGGNSTGSVDERTPKNPRTRDILTWVQAVMVILAISSILATKLLPRATGMAVSTALLDAMVIVFIVAVPILEVIIWRLLRQLPTRGGWRLALIVVSLEIGVPVGSVMVFATTFLPALTPPEPITVALLVVVCGAFASMMLGLLLVFVGFALDVVRFFQHRRQVRMGGGRSTRG